MLPIIQRYPFGVDWIEWQFWGQIVEIKVKPSSTNYRYLISSAASALSAWLQSTTGIDASSAVFELGQYTLIVLIIGFGALDHHGAVVIGAVGILGFGLFAKTHDSVFQQLRAISLIIDR